jgi:hypothetical protein
MKKSFSKFLLYGILAVLINACKKDETPAVLNPPAAITGFTASVNQVNFSTANDSSVVVTFKWPQVDYGAKVVSTYTLQFDLPADTAGTAAWGKAKTVTVDAGKLEKSFLGTDLNAFLITQLGLPTDVTSTVAIRLKADVNQSTGTASTVSPVYATVTMAVKPYKAVVVYPALLVKGGNSWHTPTTRTNGYLLTSVKFDENYEGYLNLPNADSYGGDAFQLVSTTDAKVYGWGGSSTTLSVGGGNLWLTPAPNYMRVKANTSNLTIDYTPVKFFISGDDNGWSTSATPMTFDAAGNTWVANNVPLTAGKAFVFTSNGSYDISFKVDAKGNLVFGGAPTWVGNNIPVATTGKFKVTLDLSGGAGNYTYKLL